MKIQDLETKIAARADTAVQAKISVFKNAIDKALSDLFGKTNTGIDQFGMYEYSQTVSSPAPISSMKLAALKMAIKDHDNLPDSRKKFHPWPAFLWEREREDIRNELLSKMDLMQQLLTSKQRSTDKDVPCEEGKNIV